MVTSQPTDLWGALTAKAARLECAVVLLSVAVLVLGAAVGWQTWQGHPVHYIPPGGPGLSQPGVIPDTYATDMASRFLTRRWTFTPATIKAAHNDIRQALHPSLTSAFAVQAEREAIVVKEKQLSSQVAVLSATVSGRTAQTVTVALDAVRSVYVGGVQVREEPLHAEITVAPWVASGSPTGLVVIKATTTPPLAP